MRYFTPPGRIERRGEHPLFGRLPLVRGVSLLKEDGFYVQVDEPTPERIALAEAAYIGGHVYPVTDTEAAALDAAGYGEWITVAGFGSGIYGDGLYGED